MSNFKHVYIVIRVDPPRLEIFRDSAEPIEWELIITAKRVLFSEEEARQEVNRLNKLNSNKGSAYFYQRAKVMHDDYGKWGSI